MPLPCFVLPPVITQGTRVLKWKIKEGKTEAAYSALVRSSSSTSLPGGKAPAGVVIRTGGVEKNQNREAQVTM